MNMVRANETAMMFTDDMKAQFDEKALFVGNLGWLLSQTREEVVSCYLKDSETVAIKYRSGYEQTVNVAMDSYMAIVRDVAKSV